MIAWLCLASKLLYIKRKGRKQWYMIMSNQSMVHARPMRQGETLARSLLELS